MRPYYLNPVDVLPVGDLNIDRVRIKPLEASEIVDASEFQWDPSMRPVKEISRHVVAKTSGKNKKHLLVMPGSTGRDIEILRHYGVATPQSKWTIVERESKYRRMLRERKLFKNYANVLDHEDHYNTLSSLEIKERFGKTIPYDFAWFDLLGNLGLNDIFWLKDSFPANYPELDLFFTFRFAARGNRTVIMLRNTLWAWEPERMHETRLSIQPSKALRKQKGMYGDVGYDPRALTRSTVMDENIATHQELFRYIFRDYQFDTRAWIYNDADSTEMLLYHLKNFEAVSDEERPFADKIHSIIDLYSRYNKKAGDRELAKETPFTQKQVKQWRAINRLPTGRKLEEYKLAVGLESMLLSDKAPTGNLAEICCQRLAEFHPFIDDKIACDTTRQGVSIHSPKGVYRITIGDQVQFKPDNPFRVTISPEFLDYTNRQALFSVFRNMFRADEFLHPQLCYYGYELEGKPCFILSDTQRDAITAWLSSYYLNENKGLIVLPTGMGKTIVAASVVSQYYQDNPRAKILFFTHYREILREAIEKFKHHTPFKTEKDYCRFYGASKSKFDCLLTAPCVFATDASLVKLNKRNKVAKNSPLLQIPKDHFDLIIVDEAHHINAARWAAIVDYFSRSKAGADYILGLTATPFRGDQQDPAEHFDNNTLIRKNLNRGIWEGYLAWPDYYLYEDRTDYREIVRLMKESLKSKTAEKKVNAQLGKLHQRKCLSPEFQELVFERYLQHAAGKKTIGFASNKRCAAAMAQFFTEQGVPATYLTSMEKNETVAEYRQRRANAYEGFLSGKYEVLFAVEIFNEGVDIPDVEAIIKLNRTSSPVKIIQQLGRGLRLSPDKTSVTIIDFVGNYQDLDAFINLGKMTGTNSRLLNQLHRKHGVAVEEDLPIIPDFNFHISEGAKFVVKNVVEDATIISLSPFLERRILADCKKGYYTWHMARLDEKYGATREQIEQLCANVATAIDEELRDKLKRGLLYRQMLAGAPIEVIANITKTPVEFIEQHVAYTQDPDLIQQFIDQTGSFEIAADILDVEYSLLEELLSQ